MDMDDFTYGNSKAAVVLAQILNEHNNQTYTNKVTKICLKVHRNIEMIQSMSAKCGEKIAFIDMILGQYKEEINDTNLPDKIKSFLWNVVQTIAKKSRRGLICSEIREDEKYITESRMEKQSSENPDSLLLKVKVKEANTVDENGVVFSEDCLKRCLKQFINRPFFIERRVWGKVIDSEWDEESKCVYVTASIDRKRFPFMCRNIEQGYFKDGGVFFKKTNAKSQTRWILEK